MVEIMIESLVIEKVISTMHGRSIKQFIGKEGPKCQNLYMNTVSSIRKRVYRE